MLHEEVQSHYNCIMPVLSPLIAKEDNPGKFELPDAESVCSAEDPLLEVPQEVELPINDLLVPKLIT